jgi:cytochrome c-type biogenesis protein
MTLDIVLIGFAFSADAVAFLNPCGFAMLPTYVSYFVESNTQVIITASSNSRLILVRRLTRGGLIVLLVTASFIVTLGLTGIAISSIGIGIAKFLPWIAVVSGIVIIGIGIAKIFGRTINIDIQSPRGLLYTTNSGNESGKKPSFANFFLFGTLYPSV